MKPIIVIDPGHGGHDSGAVGPGRTREKDVALSVALLLAEQLADVATVRLTRKTDVFIDLVKRAEIGNDAKADLFLSIHCNSATNPARGFEVFTTKGQTLSDTAATDLFLAYASEFRELGQRKDLSDGDVDKEADFAVLRHSRGPAVLFELEFIHTKEGEAWLASEATQQRMAQALALGVANFFDIDMSPIGPVADEKAKPGSSAEVIALLDEAVRASKAHAEEMLANLQAIKAQMKGDAA